MSERGPRADLLRLVNATAVSPAPTFEGQWSSLSLREANVTLLDCDHRTPPTTESGFPYVAIPQVKQGRINLAGRTTRAKRSRLSRPQGHQTAWREVA